MRIENEQIHYRTRFELCPYETTDQALTPALKCIFIWICHKKLDKRSELFSLLEMNENRLDFFSSSFQYPDGYAGGLNIDNKVALCTRAIRKRGRRSPQYWALEFDEPDKQNPFRHWHTRIGLSVTDDDTCIINAKVTNYLLPGYFGAPMRDPGANIPNFVTKIIGLEGYQCCVGDTKIEQDVVMLDEENFQREFAENLTSSDRQIPLILVTSDQEGHYPVSNLRTFASYFLGMANVYALDWRNWELRSQLFDLFLKDTPAFSYRCNCGNLRIYLPGINLDKSSESSNHRFYTLEQIEGRYKNERSFADMLNRCFGRSYLKTEEDILDVSDITLREGRIAVEENRRKLSELKERLATMQAKTPQQDSILDSSLGEEEFRKLKEQLIEERNSVSFLNEFIEAMEQSQKDLESQNETLELKILELEEENQEYQSQKYYLESETRRANDNAEEARALRNELSVINSLTHVPTTLEEVLDLSASLWRDKIIVLNEARKSARDFRQYDLDESWRMLSSMANVLWNLCFTGDGSRNLEQEYLEASGIELTLRERGLTNSDPECRRLRKRQFEGRTIDITPHIKGNGSRNASNTEDKFRIHFCIDGQTRKLIVGHCGEHLKTSGTGRM